MPAKADIEPRWAELDSRFRGNDKTTGRDSIQMRVALSSRADRLGCCRRRLLDRLRTPWTLRQRRWRWCAPRAARRPVDAPVDFDVNLACPDHRFTRTIFSIMAGMNAWPPKPGLTVITRTRSSRSSTYSIALSGVPGLIATPAILPRADGLQRTVEMPPRLGVNGDAIGAGLGESFEIRVAGRDHQVAVERLVGQGPKALR